MREDELEWITGAEMLQELEQRQRAWVERMQVMREQRPEP
jgi:hypothetical protein